MRQNFKKNKTLKIFFSPIFTLTQVNQPPMQKLLHIFFLFFLLMGCNDAKQADEEYFSSQEMESSAEIDSPLVTRDQTIQKVTASQLVQMLALDKAYLIDSRSVEEYNEKRIGNAIHFNFTQNDDAEMFFKKLDRKRTFYIYGKNESQIQNLGEWLIKQGVNQVYILDGGLQAWEEAQLPTIH
jgi:rhodanese-related sulfurtransferase